MQIFDIIKIRYICAQNKPTTKKMKNLNKTMIALMIGAITLPAMESCKKGENDPGMTFKSRDKRLLGTWELTSSEEKTTSTNTSSIVNPAFNSSLTVVTTTTFSGGSEKKEKVTTDTKTPGTTITETITDVQKMTVEITIDENGTFTMKATFTPASRTQVSSPAETCDTGETISPDGSGLSCDGIYNYAGTNNTSTSTGYWHWMDAKKNKVMLNMGGTEYYIDRLAKDELVLLMDGSSDNSSIFSGGTSGNGSVTTGTWTLSKK